MQLNKKRISRPLLIRDSKILSKAPEVGLVLMDMSLKPILCDRGAAAILKVPSSANPDADVTLPKELIEFMASRTPNDWSSTKMTFRVGHSEYTCRTYVMEPENGFPPMIALHIERVSSVYDAIGAVAAKYRLTEREQEALAGISMGLSSKELAEKMNISPNTVKVFLRLIMIKMGVMTRGGIVAQILQNQSTPDERGDRSFTARA